MLTCSSTPKPNDNRPPQRGDFCEVVDYPELLATVIQSRYEERNWPRHLNGCGQRGRPGCERNDEDESGKRPRPCQFEDSPVHNIRHRSPQGDKVRCKVPSEEALNSHRYQSRAAKRDSIQSARCLLSSIAAHNSGIVISDQPEDKLIQQSPDASTINSWTLPGSIKCVRLPHPSARKYHALSVDCVAR